MHDKARISKCQAALKTVCVIQKSEQKLKSLTLRASDLERKRDAPLSLL